MSSILGDSDDLIEQLRAWYAPQLRQTLGSLRAVGPTGPPPTTVVPPMPTSGALPPAPGVGAGRAAIARNLLTQGS